MFEQCSSRTYVRGHSLLAELHELDCRLHFEHSSVDIQETIEQAKVLMGLALEFAPLDVPNCVTVERQKRALSRPHNGAACAIPCSRHVRAMFELCLSMSLGSAAISLCEVAATGPKKIVYWNEWPLWQVVASLQFVCVWPKRQ